MGAMFEGQQESTVTCGACGKVSRTRELFRDLQLEIPSGHIVSLQVCCPLASALSLADHD